MRAIVCQDNDRYDNAFRDLGEALRLDPDNIAALIERSFLWRCATGWTWRSRTSTAP